MASFVNQFTLLGRSLFVPHLLPHPLISKFNRLIHQSDKNKTTTNKQTIKRKKRKTNLRCRNGKPSHPPSTLSRIATTAYSRPYPDAFQLRRTAFLLFSDLPPPPTLSARLVPERKKKRDARGEKKGKETSASNILPFFFFCWACIYCCASLFFFFFFELLAVVCLHNDPANNNRSRSVGQAEKALFFFFFFFPGSPCF